MLFLICLDPLLNKRIHKASANIGYHEHNNEEVKLQNLIIELFLMLIHIRIYVFMFKIIFEKEKKCNIGNIHMKQIYFFLQHVLEY